jgi:hypothetical protein
MRLLVDSLIALMLVAILGGVLVHHRQQQKQLEDYQFIHRSLARLHEQAVYHGALADSDLSANGFPAELHPHWFGDDLPVNVLLPGRQAWLDVAPPGDMSDQPPDPVVVRADQAGFWYNANRGIFRVRVPPQFSDQQTLKLYNDLNGTALLSLRTDGDPARQPIAHKPLPVQTAESAKLLDRAGEARVQAVAGGGDASNNPARRPKLRPSLLDQPKSQ